MPTVNVFDLDSTLATPTVTGIAAEQNGTGYGFGLTFAASPSIYMFAVPPRIVLETTFAINCGGETRQVRALTALYLCSDSMTTAVGWASSGDRCIECASVCEMAASPILPAEEVGPMALSGAVRARVRVLGLVHGALVLLAEHNGGEGFEYERSATGGRLVWVDRDVALWVPPESTLESQLVQVAMSSDRAVGVASLRWGAMA